MKIAIIVVNWNSGNYLLKCLRSIKNQTISPNKVIVVDNDSTDGSLKQAELEFHDVTFLKNNYNAGFAAANNLSACCTIGLSTIMPSTLTTPPPASLNLLITALANSSSCLLGEKVWLMIET